MSGKKQKTYRRALNAFYTDSVESVQPVIYSKPLKKRIKIAFCIIFKKSFDLFRV